MGTHPFNFLICRARRTWMPRGPGEGDGAFVVPLPVPNTVDRHGHSPCWPCEPFHCKASEFLLECARVWAQYLLRSREAVGLPALRLALEGGMLLRPHFEWRSL